MPGAWRWKGSMHDVGKQLVLCFMCVRLYVVLQTWTDAVTDVHTVGRNGGAPSDTTGPDM